MMRRGLVILAAAIIIAGAGIYIALSGGYAKLQESATVGPSPTISDPDRRLVPTINIAPATGWPYGEKPHAAPGLSVEALVTGLDHPRWLYVLPNGDLLVAETNAPADRPEEGKGIKGFVFRMAQKRAGAGVPSPNRIVLLRAADNGQVTKTTFLENLNSPFGMALVGNDFYVADTDAVLRFTYPEGATHIDGHGEKIADLPAGPINHHWTKNLVASNDGSKLYVTVGSNSNVGENGLDKEEHRAAIFEMDRQSGKWRIFASGLRNPNGMGWEPETGVLWTVANERDELGSDLVPDYLTSVKDGAFYGWPFSYYGQHVDTRVPQKPEELVAKAIAPDYALGSHVAALGLTFSSGMLLPKSFRNGAFVGEHGSWNRKPASGYKVVFIPFANGQPSGPPVEVLNGFLAANGDARGRPVGVAIAKDGALLVADDVGNTVWRVTPSSQIVGQDFRN